MSPEMKKWATTSAYDMVSSSPAGLAKVQADESERTGRVVRAAGIEPE
jgi:hypothetical protein